MGEIEVYLTAAVKRYFCILLGILLFVPPGQALAQPSSDRPLTATVQPWQARFIFPLNDRPVWQWNLTSDAMNSTEYSWIVNVQDGAEMYQLGFRKFKLTYDGPNAQNGSVEALLKAGQVNLAHKDGDTFHFINGVDLVVQHIGGHIVVLLTGQPNVSRVFSTYPASVTFELRQPGQPPVTKIVAVNYLNSTMPPTAKMLNAAARGDWNAVKATLDIGAQINAIGGDGNSALALAVKSNNTDAVALLTEHGATARDSAVPMTYLAATFSNKRMIDLLLDHGGDPNLGGVAGIPALNIAAFFGRTDIANSLISHHADVNANPNAPYTETDMSALLVLDKTGHKNIPTQGTALVIAVARGDKQMVDLLLSHHANPSLANSLRWAPLHGGASSGRLDIVEALVKAGADVNAKTSDGQSPADLARQYKHSDVVAFLTAHGGKTFITPTVADFKKAMLAANIAHGAELSQRCAMCHDLTPGGMNKIGPALYGIVGMPIATRPGYIYSSALKAKGGVWDDQSLYRYLMSPPNYAPGTKMSFGGFMNAQDAIDVIAYIKTWK